MDSTILKPLILGECNPYGADPAFALFPAPKKSAGYRLAVTILGLSRGAYMDRFDRQNLCPEKWSTKEARANADRIKAEREGIIVLLGARVTRAFGFPFEVFTTWGSGPDGLQQRFIILPHPSGLCRTWDEHPGSFQKARDLVLGSGVKFCACGRVPAECDGSRAGCCRGK